MQTDLMACIQRAAHQLAEISPDRLARPGRTRQ
ncbi:hypothetical protein KPSA1_03530 [Pseudomonas syringae pv. actinidiae]|uniref:Uncharacterized protein n=1 Tax=Pseudomonas syringae pv. actinidiae TaxID=103796 RepID=A0A2V0QNE2_PSESF|nr:hypothetical protein KPSA1_03530 [Pseudomonas syringae pv. actinidiae]